jgi:hypothetical protein
MAAANRYRRRMVNFRTELEGLIPTYGDLIAIAHDMPRWGESGDVVAYTHPILTYSFFLLFATVKVAALFKLLDSGVAITDGLIAVWDIETQALFAAVMSFWFGQRALSKFRANI